MQTFKSYLNEEQELLTEADTSKATNAEMAICVAYNMKKGMTREDAAIAAGVLADEEKWKDLLGLGKTIVNDNKKKLGKNINTFWKRFCK